MPRPVTNDGVVASSGAPHRSSTYPTATNSAGSVAHHSRVGAPPVAAPPHHAGHIIYSSQPPPPQGHHHPGIAIAYAHAPSHSYDAEDRHYHHPQAHAHHAHAQHGYYIPVAAVPPAPPHGSQTTSAPSSGKSLRGVAGSGGGGPPEIRRMPSHEKPHQYPSQHPQQLYAVGVPPYELHQQPQIVHPYPPATAGSGGSVGSGGAGNDPNMPRSYSVGSATEVDQQHQQPQQQHIYHVPPAALAHYRYVPYPPQPHQQAPPPPSSSGRNADASAATATAQGSPQPQPTDINQSQHRNTGKISDRGDSSGRTHHQQQHLQHSNETSTADHQQHSPGDGRSTSAGFNGGTTSKWSCTPQQMKPEVKIASAYTNGSDQSPSQNNEENTGVTCTCKKSKCLKLYCQCFASKVMCNGDCRCLVCLNTPAYEKARTDAIRTILSRNPSAFDDKFSKGASETGKKGASKSQHKVGCKCRRSACLKKYCECYNAGVKCSANCRCQDCRNTVDGRGNGAMTTMKFADLQPYPTSYPVVIPAAPPSRAASAASSPTQTIRSTPGESFPDPGTEKPKASPGDPWIIEDAAKNLAFLKKGSPNQSKQNLFTSSDPDVSAMPSLTSSEEVSPFDDGKQDPGSTNAKQNNGLAADVISPNTEKQSSAVVDTLLLAASALTDLSGSCSPSKAVPTQKEVVDDALKLESTENGPETANSSQQSSVLARSPKRKSSFDIDSRRKNARDDMSVSGSALFVDSNDPKDQELSTSGEPTGPTPFTPPTAPKTKKSRIGSVKKPDYGSSFGDISAAKETLPRHPHPGDVGLFDSAARPSKAQADSDEDGVSTTSPASNGDNNGSDNDQEHNDGSDREVFRERTSTPPDRIAGDAMTPVSSRIVGLRRLDVNDGMEAMAGESIKMDVELEKK